MNKKIIIFGGTGGLGSQLVSKLGAEGYTVKGLSSKDVDVTDYAQVEGVMQEHIPDIVINLAGANADSFLHKLSDTNNREAARKVMKVNTVGVVNVVAAALPHMRSNQYGRIILTSSVLTKKPVMGTGVYGSSKTFIKGLVMTCGLENASKNVTCNALQLGYFDGGLTHKIPDKVKTVIKDSIPAGRWGTIDELYNTVKFLIDTPYCNGTSIEVDGGIQ